MSIVHGVRVTEVATGARPIKAVSLSVIGLIATGSDADAGVFPLNTAVLITDIRAAITKAGTLGTLLPSLNAIAAEVNPILVVVRTSPGANATEQKTNAIAGCAKLETAESRIGVRPRILGAPGLDVPEVTAALVASAQKLNAFVYASDNGAATVSDAIDYRSDYAARELMILHGDWKSGTTTINGVAKALGVRARIDNQQGVQKTLSNVPVNGVTGVSIPITFDLQSSANDAGLLNADEVTALIHANGFRYWGNRTCSDDPAFAFESTVRISQLIRDMISAGVVWALDKPLYPSLARDVLGTINAAGRDLKRDGIVIDFKAWIDPLDNDQTSLAGGKLKIRYNFTPPPPLEDLELVQIITDEYLANFVSQVNG